MGTLRAKASESLSPHSKSEKKATVRRDNDVVNRGSNSLWRTIATSAAQQTSLGLIQAKYSSQSGAEAEDVGAIADAAADGTASEGFSLPHGEQIQAAFGDHDVSGIRAHVGGKAGDAADSMRAEAFATGIDVAFKGSPDLHTAAHEAAHVVQQRSGVQLYGGVGQEGDSYEQEADAVADMVVAGQSAAPLLAKYAGASVKGGGVQMRKKKKGKVYNFAGLELSTESVTEQYETAAEMGEASELKDAEENPSVTMKISNRKEISKAESLLKEIKGYEPNLEKGFKDGNISGSVFAANEHAKNVLGDFLVSAGSQGQTLSEFQKNWVICKGDLGRFLGQLNYFQEQNPEALEQPGGSLVETISRKTPNEMEQDVRDLGGSNAVFGGHWSNVNQSHTSMQLAADKVGQTQMRQVTAAHLVVAKLSALEAGVVSRMKADPGSRAKLEDITEASGLIKRMVNKGVGLIPGGSAVTDATDVVVEAIVDELFAEEIEALEKKIAVANMHQADFANAEVINAVRAAITNWVAAALEYQGSIRALKRQKNSMRSSSAMLATSAESELAGWNFDMAILVQMFAEADAMSAQCRATINLGRAEQSAAAFASSDRSVIRGSKDEKWKDSLDYYVPVQAYRNKMRGWLDPRSIGMTYEAVKRRVGFNIVSSSGAYGYTEGEKAGANPVMASSLGELKNMLELANAIRNELGKSLAMGDLNDGNMTVGSAPSHTNAKKRQ